MQCDDCRRVHDVCDADEHLVSDANGAGAESTSS